MPLVDWILCTKCMACCARIPKTPQHYQLSSCFQILEESFGQDLCQGFAPVRPLK